MDSPICSSGSSQCARLRLDIQCKSGGISLPRIGGSPVGQEMVSFFPEPRDPDSLPPHDAQPEWAGPPDDVMPVLVPIHLIIGRSDNAVVVLTRVRAYRSGLAISITAQTRQADRYEDLGREVDVAPGHRRSGPVLARQQIQVGCRVRRRAQGDQCGPGPRPRRWPLRAQLETRPSGADDQRRLFPRSSGPPTWSAGCGRCRRRGACGWSVSGLVRASTSPCMSWRHSLSSTPRPEPTRSGRNPNREQG